jgi:hypothetical protein
MQYILFLTVINILILILHKWNTDKAVVRYIVRNWFYFLFLGLSGCQHCNLIIK